MGNCRYNLGIALFFIFVFLYALVSVDGKKKLYIKGDLFYSQLNASDCLRIQDIKEEFIVLEDIKTKDILVVTIGQKIPLEGTDIIFEKAIREKSVVRVK